MEAITGLDQPPGKDADLTKSWAGDGESNDLGSTGAIANKILKSAHT
ncbi:MAG: hypothetical protein AAGF33_07825 [Pseudomonadota bacterium]